MFAPAKTVATDMVSALATRKTSHRPPILLAPAAVHRSANALTMIAPIGNCIISNCCARTWLLSGDRQSVKRVSNVRHETDSPGRGESRASSRPATCFALRSDPQFWRLPLHPRPLTIPQSLRECHRWFVIAIIPGHIGGRGRANGNRDVDRGHTLRKRPWGIEDPVSNRMPHGFSCPGRAIY